MNIIDEVVADCFFRVAKRRALRRRFGQGAAESASIDDYDAWRRHMLETQFAQFFDPRTVTDKNVLDFGCGSGALTLIIARLGAASVCGIDTDAKAVARATAAAQAAGISAQFHAVGRPDRIDFEDHSFDVILCFDVLEHVMDYEKIIAEWRRVLRPQGRILIWWNPYYHPYGHHAHAYAPIPWMHVLASEEVIRKVCSKMVNLPDFKPPYWDFDEQGKRRNRFAEAARSDYLNRLTIAKFEHLCAVTGLGFARREFHTFQALKRYRLFQTLLTLPGLREFFSSYVIYELMAL